MVQHLKPKELGYSPNALSVQDQPSQPSSNSNSIVSRVRIDFFNPADKEVRPKVTTRCMFGFINLLNGHQLTTSDSQCGKLDRDCPFYYIFEPDPSSPFRATLFVIVPCVELVILICGCLPSLPTSSKVCNMFLLRRYRSILAFSIVPSIAQSSCKIEIGQISDLPLTPFRSKDHTVSHGERRAIARPSGAIPDDEGPT